MGTYYKFQVEFYDHTDDIFIVQSWEDLFKCIENFTKYGKYDILNVKLIEEKLV